MSVIAELSVPVEDFPLGRALESTPEMQVELERVVPTGNAILPFFWVRGDDVTAFLDALADDDSIETATVLDRVADGALVRATWAPGPGVVTGVVESGVVLLEVRHRSDAWVFRVRSDDRESIADLQRYCADHDVDLRLHWIHGVDEVETGDQYGLTDDQRRTVVAAYDAGYFEDPRGTTLEALAGEFDISPRAVSKRLRGGLRNLVATTLAADE